MSFESDLKSHLQADSTIAGYVRDRIYPVIVAESASMPAITYSLIAGDLVNDISGFDGNLTRYTVQIDCWALTFGSVINVALAVRNRMNTAATNFRSVITEYPQFDDYEPVPKRYRRSLSVACWHRE